MLWQMMKDEAERRGYAKPAAAEWRKARPVFSGVLAYFPDALMEVAAVSKIGNDQHNPGQPLHWAREKSTDQLDAALRHMTDRAKGEKLDTDGGRHLAKAAWRILAELQLELEREKEEAEIYAEAEKPSSPGAKRRPVPPTNEALEALLRAASKDPRA